MKSMAYTVLQSYANDQILVTKSFCATTNFWRTVICRTPVLLVTEQIIEMYCST